VVYAPSYQPPEPGDELLPGPPPLALQSHGDGWWYSEAFGFYESGTYRVVVYAADEDGLESRPKELVLYVGRVYLPLLIK
jgi:hypothetical protein